MLTAEDARMLVNQALAVQFDRICRDIDKAVYQAALRGDREVQVAEIRDSRVMDMVSKAGYCVSYYLDDGGFYHVSW